MNINTPMITAIQSVQIFYAGVGSRRITVTEQDQIRLLAAELSRCGLIVYSGNADGADVAFQEGSGGRCVIMLPSDGFNHSHYDPAKSLAYYTLGDKTLGQQAVHQFHPRHSGLTSVAKRFLARNFYQVMGCAEYPKADFVVSVADVDAVGHEVGGTGHTCRIARHHKVPIFNLRSLGLDKTWDAIVSHVATLGKPIPSGLQMPVVPPSVPTLPPEAGRTRKGIAGMPNSQREAVEQALRSAVAWGLTYGTIIPPKQQGEMLETQVAQHMAAIEKWGRL